MPGHLVFIPSMGTFYSQYGNESVPEWERFVPLLEK